MNKLMILATVFTASVAVAQPALADYDTVGSALVGGVAGAVIGHAVGGRNGAAVGAAIGGVSGALISANQPRGYYGGYSQPVVYSRPYYAAPVVAAPVAYYPEHPVVYGYQRVDYPVAYYGHHDWHRGWYDNHGYYHDGYDHDRGYARY